MHQCLYCGESCIETTIFCDACRASLLKRQQPSDAEQAERATQRVYERSAAPLIENGVDACGEKPATPLSILAYRKPLPIRPRPILPVIMMLGAISLVTGGILLAANILHHISLSDMASTTGNGVVLSPRVGSTTWPGETQTSAISPVGGTALPTSTSVITGTGTKKTTSGTTTPAPRGGTPISVPATSTPITCALQAAPVHLSFTATLLQPDPPGQSITLKTSGSCGKPVTWKATANSSWIQLSSSTGSENGSGSAVTVYARANAIIGTFTADITFTAMDNNGITSSPQTVSVTLTVLG